MYIVYSISMVKKKRVRKYYPTGAEHHNFKKKRNDALIRDRYPNWPATGTIGLSISELQEKYQITYNRVYQIINLMKVEEFGYA